MSCLLDELNTILRKSKLNIPSHKQEVYTNGKNFKWLKKNFLNDHNIGSNKEPLGRLQYLLSLNINELNKKTD